MIEIDIGMGIRMKIHDTSCQTLVIKGLTTYKEQISLHQVDSI